MNKDDLIIQIAQDQKITKTDAQYMLEASLKGITNLMKNGQNLTLVGFGSFIVWNREVREARNPNTQETVTVPEKNYVSFRAGEKLREAVNFKKALSAAKKKKIVKNKLKNISATIKIHKVSSAAKVSLKSLEKKKSKKS
ncbi:MAG: HU family DNA-binding protein [Rickettsia sp.]|nr:HU family DNA-binding protein [Rickettsia sp.]